MKITKENKEPQFKCGLFMEIFFEELLIFYQRITVLPLDDIDFNNNLPFEYLKLLYKQWFLEISEIIDHVISDSW